MNFIFLSNFVKKEKIPEFLWTIEKWLIEGEMVDVLHFQTLDGNEFRCTLEELDRIIEQCYDEQDDDFRFVQGSTEEN